MEFSRGRFVSHSLPVEPASALTACQQVTCQGSLRETVPAALRYQGTQPWKKDTKSINPTPERCLLPFRPKTQPGTRDSGPPRSVLHCSTFWGRPLSQLVFVQGCFFGLGLWLVHCREGPTYCGWTKSVRATVQKSWFLIRVPFT